MGCLCFLLQVRVAQTFNIYLLVFLALLDFFLLMLTYSQILTINLQTTVILLPIETMAKATKHVNQTFKLSKLTPGHPASPTVPNLLTKSFIQTGDTAASLRKVQLNLRVYILMKWTTSLLQTHFRRVYDIPDSSALVTSQANGTCQWSRLLFLSQPRERRAIKSNWSLQESCALGPRRPRQSGCFIIMWPSCRFW